MVYYDPNESEPPADPDEVAERLANQLEQNSRFSSDAIETVRTSETPLAEPIGYPLSSTGSARSAIRYTVLSALQNVDEIIGVAFSKTLNERAVSITTHPSILEKSNRLLHPASLVKVYQYGYWLRSWSVTEGGKLPDSVNSVTGVPWELRELSLVWKDEYFQEDFESDERWFSDEEAVADFATRVTDDDDSWAQYIPWYRTTPVSTYRLTRTAQTTDWTEFPDHPNIRPNIKDRFDTSVSPRVGNFIRMAILQELERSLPSIGNLSTGPDAWKTDRLSIVVTPPSADTGCNGGELCPSVALKKLADYGYRPIDGWYDAPAVGYDSDDPMVPRRLEFARGRALQTWCDAIQTQSPLFGDVATVREAAFLPQIEWQTIIPCARSQIISYRQLQNLAQKPEEQS